MFVPSTNNNNGVVVPIGESPITEKSEIFKLYQRSIEILLIIWYAIKHAIHVLNSLDPFSRKRIFGDNIICATQNFGKFSDIPEYVNYKFHPMQATVDALESASFHGLIAKKRSYSPKPHTKGHCLGNVAYFLKKWGENETGDMEEIAAEFKGGTPIEAARMQKASRTLFKPEFHMNLANAIENILICYPLISMPQERKKWMKKFKPALPILEALECYLLEGNRPEKNNLVKYVSTWVWHHHRKAIGGPVLATLYYVSEKFDHQDRTDQLCLKAFFESEHLPVETFYAYHKSSADILEALPHLPSGSYCITLPTFSSSGEKDSHHAIGLIIEGDICYLFDPNYAIGWSTRAEIAQTVGRVFTEYTGLDYKENLHGERPTFWGRVNNYILERGNPPDSLEGMRFNLMKVHTADTD